MKRIISNFESNILIKCIHQNVLILWGPTGIVGGRQMQSFFKEFIRDTGAPVSIINPLELVPRGLLTDTGCYFFINHLKKLP